MPFRLKQYTHARSSQVCEKYHNEYPIYLVSIYIANKIFHLLLLSNICSFLIFFSRAAKRIPYSFRRPWYRLFMLTQTQRMFVERTTYVQILVFCNILSTQRTPKTLPANRESILMPAPEKGFVKRAKNLAKTVRGYLVCACSFCCTISSFQPANTLYTVQLVS